MVKIYGRLFLLSSASGAAAGIAQECQLGLSWSEYSRFAGAIFGALPAIEWRLLSANMGCAGRVSALCYTGGRRQ